MTLELTTVPREWGSQARVKAKEGQVGPVQALLTFWALILLLCSLWARSVAWELIKMSQRIMMSGARITLQEG